VIQKFATEQKMMMDSMEHIVSSGLGPHKKLTPPSPQFMQTRKKAGKLSHEVNERELRQIMRNSSPPMMQQQPGPDRWLVPDMGKKIQVRPS
jgi:hypothetical protein